MFTTFVAATADQNENQVATTNHSTSTSASNSTSLSTSARPKRSQVARACDWCRLHRIKCDTQYPCRNCQARGGQCSRRSGGRNSSGSSSEIRTLPAALREIERLREEVKELRTQLEEEANKTTTTATTTITAEAEPSSSDDLRVRTHPRSFRHGLGTPERRWEGIQTRTAQSHQTQWYGPSSTFYFIGRMKAYLATALEQPQLDDHHLQPNSASRAFTSPLSPKEQPAMRSTDSATSHSVPTTVEDVNQASHYLPGIQEDYFLSHFWQSYHCIFQIVDETEFREHYKSLWADPSSSSNSSSSSTSPPVRRPSALVDIILALCMQYALAVLPRDKDAMPPRPDDVDTDDASIAGRWYYRRSQSLLTSEVESPSITTLQCHIFSVIYLCNASFQNMAHTTLALAVRTAHILGLHLDPPQELPREKRELRRRLWWTLCAVESKTSMKLGRPLSVPDQHVTCQLPAADHELALLSGSNFASYGQNLTWLTYNLLSTKLVLTVQDIYTSFYDRCSEVIAANGGRSLYHDLQGLDTCAKHLTAQIDDGLKAWLSEVPEALKTQRKNGGKPFATDHSSLEVERFAPLWLQRQRVILELLYHNLSMNLFRPFICFPSTSSTLQSTTDYCPPTAESHAISCVTHAIAITHILREVLTDTDILSGWYEAFQWQWNATLGMVGFVLAYPAHPTTPKAREAIDHAIAVFEMYGSKFAVSASAANVTRDLTVKADALIDRLCHPEPGSRPGATFTPESFTANGVGFFPGDGQPNLNVFPEGGLAGGIHDDPSVMFQNTLAGAMGLANTADSFYSFEPLYAGSWNMGDAWVSGQDQLF